MNIEQAKRELKKKAFSFENSDGSLKNSTVWLKDVIEILDALSLLTVVSNNEVSVCLKCGNTGRCEPRTLSDPDGQECDCRQTDY